MEIKFTGTGPLGSKTKRTSSGFFVYKDVLYIIDIGSDNMKFYKKFLEETGVKKIIICITHTHPNHISGLPEFLIWVHFFFNSQKRIIIVSDELVMIHIKNLIEITGTKPFTNNVDYMYTYIGSFYDNLTITPIKTSHVKAIPSCGFLILEENLATLYSGDTNKPMLKVFEDYCVIYNKKPMNIYHEVSVNKSEAHTSLEELEAEFEKTDFVKSSIYLFHCEETEIIKQSGFKMAVETDVVV